MKFSTEGLIFLIVVSLALLVAIATEINHLWPVLLLGGGVFLYYKHTQKPKSEESKKCDRPHK